MKSDLGFFAFIKKRDKKLLVLISAIVLVAFMLMLFGGEDKDVGGEDAEDEEKKLCRLCSEIEGVGECRVMITYRDGEVFAVAIVCRGANNYKVREALIELVTSIYGIGSNRVSIQPLASG